MKPDVMQDQEMMEDLLISESRMTSVYNQFTNTCTNAQIHDQFQDLLNEEHEMQADLFEEIQNRGWSLTPTAPRQKIEQMYQKYQANL